LHDLVVCQIGSGSRLQPAKVGATKLSLNEPTKGNVHRFFHRRGTGYCSGFCEQVVVDVDKSFRHTERVYTAIP